MIQIDLENMEKSLLLVEDALEVLSLDPKQHFQAAFVCEEILTNLARHADFEQRVPEVSLSMEPTAQKDLQLAFRDNSVHFDFLNFPDPEIGGELDEKELGGLGVYLTKQYAKKISYTQENGYNTLEVIL